MGHFCPILLLLSSEKLANQNALSAHIFIALRPERKAFVLRIKYQISIKIAAVLFTREFSRVQFAVFRLNKKITGNTQLNFAQLGGHKKGKKNALLDNGTLAEINNSSR